MARYFALTAGLIKIIGTRILSIANYCIGEGWNRGKDRYTTFLVLKDIQNIASLGLSKLSIQCHLEEKVQSTQDGGKFCLVCEKDGDEDGFNADRAK